MYKLEFLKTVIWSKFLYKSIDSSATNRTFVTKGEIEIESNFLTTPHHRKAQIESLGPDHIEPASD